FLNEGNKVRAYVFFRGRSILFKEQGEVLLLRFANDLEGFGKVEQMPKLEGKKMFLYMAPKKVAVVKKSQQRLDREKLESASLSTDKVEKKAEEKNDNNVLIVNAKNNTEVLSNQKEDKTSED
nr:translation initiation factor IF-3 C-terminal domain-containing protein [Prevotella sp.]